MVESMQNLDLRKKLDDLISQEDERNWYIPELFIRNTKDKLPPDLEIIDLPPAEDDNYNCFLYTLGLHTNSEIIKETKGFIYSSFIEAFINDNLLVDIKGKPEVGDIILYRDPETVCSFSHSGIRDVSGLVLSKWAWGPTIRHNILDIPLHWGSEYGWYRLNIADTMSYIYSKYKHFNKK